METEGLPDTKVGHYYSLSIIMETSYKLPVCKTNQLKQVIRLTISSGRNSKAVSLTSKVDTERKEPWCCGE